MPKGTFDEKQFKKDPSQPDFKTVYEVPADGEFTSKVYWAPTDFDILFYYQIGLAAGYFQAFVQVKDFDSEAEIEDSLFGPYSRCSYNGYKESPSW